MKPAIARASVLIDFLDGTIFSAIQIDANKVCKKLFGSPKDNKRASIEITKSKLIVKVFKRNGPFDITIKTATHGTSIERRNGPNASYELTVELESRSSLFYIIFGLLLIGLMLGASLPQNVVKVRT